MVLTLCFKLSELFEQRAQVGRTEVGPSFIDHSLCSKNSATSLYFSWSKKRDI